MTEEQEPAESSSDALLQLLVNIANGNDGPLPLLVTLCVNGVLISGRIIGRKKYFEELGGQIRQAFEPYQDLIKDKPEDLESWFRGFGEPDKTDKKESDDAEDPEGDDITAIRYIHLQDATVNHPGARPLPSEGGFLWRGRLANVDGFSMGVLRVQE